MSYKYSIIIPVYNAEKTLKPCLDSILKQEYRSVELILVNDGSTDASLAICNNYAEKYENVVVVNKPNGGVSSARNSGLSVAHGEFVAFVDSDDTVVDGYFDVLTSDESNDMLVFCFLENDGLNKNAVFFDSNAVSETDYFKNLCYLNRIRNGTPWNKRYKLNIIKENNISFSEQLNVGEDYIFWLNYALHCSSIHLMNEALYCYNTFEAESATRKFRPDYLEQALLIYNYAFSAVHNSCLSQNEKGLLSEILDYNYCRTAFVCAAVPVKYNSGNIGTEINKVADAFLANLRQGITRRGIVHKIMAVCIKLKLFFVYRLTAELNK